MPPSDKSAKSARRTYSVRRRIDHGTEESKKIERYEAGEEIELTDGEAAELLAIGAIAALAPAKTAGKTDTN